VVTAEASSRFDRSAALNGAALLDPAIETRSVVQWQINRQADKLFEIPAWEIEPPAENGGFAHAKAFSHKMI
jgi:hypothetical protein